MAERKVINKYMNPDYDPAVVPKLKKVKRPSATQIRLMMPFGLRCSACTNAMVTGTKCNATKEVSEGMDYLGIKRFRFRLSCSTCKAPLTFLTDPKNQDYEVESGGKMMYDFTREMKKAAAEQAAEKAQTEARGNSMQKLEDRTLKSRIEMENLEELERLKSGNRCRERVSIQDVLKGRKSAVENDNDGNDQDIAEEEQAAIDEAFSRKREKVRRLDTDIDVSKQPVEERNEDDSTLDLPSSIIVKKKKNKKRKNKNQLISYPSSSDDSD